MHLVTSLYKGSADFTWHSTFDNRWDASTEYAPPAHGTETWPINNGECYFLTFRFTKQIVTVEFRIPFLSNFQQPITMTACSGLRASFFCLCVFFWGGGDGTQDREFESHQGVDAGLLLFVLWFVEVLLQTNAIRKENHRISLSTQKAWEPVKASFSCRVSGTFPPAQQPLVGQVLLVTDASRSHWIFQNEILYTSKIFSKGYHFRTHRTRPDSSGRVISPTQTPLPDNIHNTHNIQTPMSLPGFEPPIPARERLQTYAMDRAAAGFDIVATYRQKRWERKCLFVHEICCMLNCAPWFVACT